ncbi:hypothetical protein F4778DRAFT_790988 [Xylariomycetidae sp. FL2044]|nr:hypothetical protein F4778DRAFT_790988 [Xylariomycetidae sp. FL2044]
MSIPPSSPSPDDQFQPKVHVYVYKHSPPQPLISLLKAHLPHSLPLLRRLQFAEKFPGGITPHARILYCSSSAGGDDPFSLFPPSEEDGSGSSSGSTGGRVGGGGSGGGGGRQKEDEGVEKKEAVVRTHEKNHHHQRTFAAAYLDYSRGPETEMWLYSSLEHTSASVSTSTSPPFSSSPNPNPFLLPLLRKVRDLRSSSFSSSSSSSSPAEEEKRTPGPTTLIKNNTIFVGTLAETTRLSLRDELGVVFVDDDDVEIYDKWIFDIGALSAPSPAPRTVKLLTSTALYLDDGMTPIAWAFLGPDSSLSSLHCEEAYRGRGLAKAVAVKILQDHVKDYGDEGYGWADVAPDNEASRAVCKSLGGRIGWSVSWSMIDFDRTFPDERS